MKKFLMMAALLVATLTVSAQDYNWAVGVRTWGIEGGSLTAKKTLGSNAIEAGLVLRSGLVGVDAAYEWQEPIIGEGFHLYYGAGAYVNLAKKYFGLGAEAVVGLEYRVPINFPLAVSLDYRPAINLIGGVEGNFWNFGLGLKYCF